MPTPDSMRAALTSAGMRESRIGWRQARHALYVAILCLWAGTGYWHTHKPLPEGTHVASPWHTVPLEDVGFVADVTAADAFGRPVLSHAIFDEVLAIVNGAHEFVVLDFFLFNDHRGTLEPSGMPLRPLSRELRDALIARKRAVPQMSILFVTDPINDVYGGDPSEDLAMLRAAGIDVVVTDLDQLRDSNFIYSSLWRLTLGWWTGDGGGSGWLPHPFDAGAPDVPLRAWARLANFKANHRKVVIADDGRGGLTGLVTSANPHDLSSAHSNVAVRLSGPVLRPLLASELAVARFSGWRGEIASRAVSSAAAPAEGPLGPSARVRILTEGAIRSALLERLARTGAGDAVDVAMFYLSDREIVEALIAASRRGTTVRLILDPNRDAFGRVKSGIPNRPAASELVAGSDGAIRVRWYRTHGEQFHTKLVLIYGPETLWFTLGSANLTRRNLADLNLEANVAVEVPRGTNLAAQALDYFDALWSNRAPIGMEYTADFGVYADPSQARYWRYRIMEATGLSTF